MYGTQVMNGVMQEKTNRIVEVIISSVRPFDLMMGKIIGVALVGLTQFLMWMLLTGAGLFVIQNALGTGGNVSEINQIAAMQGMGSLDETDINNMMAMFLSFDWMQIITLFIVFFLGGYLLYASLFAAIGSAVDNETDANQFTMPVTLPIILAIFAAIYAVRNPEAGASFWFSIIPFTSPVVMMVRLPFDVPTWQIALSIGILVLSFIGTTWIAGKIYRTGILMYGKKTTWKELWKWLKY
jgi:ABC-2 type transport system permease protein